VGLMSRYYELRYGSMVGGVGGASSSDWMISRLLQFCRLRPHNSSSSLYESYLMNSASSMSLSSVSIRNMSFMRFGNAYRNGGVLYLSGLHRVSLENVNVNGSVGYLGGSVYVDTVDEMSVLNSSFVSSVGWVGGSMYIRDVKNVLTVEGNVFVNNSGELYGGSMMTMNIGSLLSVGNVWRDNDVYGFGGGLSIYNVSSFDMRSCIFESNRGNWGSAMMMSLVGVNNVNSRGNVFDRKHSTFVFRNRAMNNSMVRNVARSSGSVFWIAGSMFEPHGLATMNQYVENVALGYSPDVSTSTVRVASIPNEIRVMHYTSGIFDSNLSAWISDHYGSVILTENGTLLSASVQRRDVLGSKCDMNRPFVYGELSRPIKSGRSYLGKLGVGCIPGGRTNITLSSLVSSSWSVYPSYDLVDWISARGEWIQYRSYLSTSLSVTFRNCLKGEIYDYKSMTKSTCSPCVNGFSVKSNEHRNIISCTPCPWKASYCYMDEIYLKSGYWRWGSNSSSIFECNLLGGCLGGSMTGDASCATGYVGPFCGVCDVGYYLNSRRCVECSPSSMFSSMTVILLLMLISIGFVSGFVWKYRKKLQVWLSELKVLMLSVLNKLKMFLPSV